MNKRDNFLDCIRALAVTLVVFTHYRGWMPGGSIGVSVFFCLSGFLICQILIGLPEPSAANIGKFIFRRFMRVWPMMAFQILLAFVVIAMSRHDDVSRYVAALPGLLTFTVSYGDRWIGLSPAVLWTLRAEFWFYVAFAIAFYFAGRRHLLGLIVAGIALSWPAKFWLGHGAGPFWLVYLDQLMYGALAAVILEHPPGWLRYLRSHAFLWVPLAAIILLGTIPFERYGWIWYLQTSDAALWTMILLLHHAANPVRAELGPLVTIGKISFSIYLLHALVLDTVTSTHIVNPQLDAVMIFGLIIGASLLTYRWIELPFIRLSKAAAPFEKSLPSGTLNVESIVRTNSTRSKVHRIDDDGGRGFGPKINRRCAD